MQGILLIDKPCGMTSFDVVHKVKKITGTKRVGHTGTLDPMASGVLPVLVGRATLLSDYIMSADKKYRAKIRLGITTDSYDITGKVLSESEVCVDEKRLEEVINSFLGETFQVPPMFSAIKKNGVKMYDLARKGQTVDIPPRKIFISSISVTSALENNEFIIEVTCSKGTYVRSLCNDIGKKLGCGAVLTELCRTSTGDFSLEDCIKLEDINEENISQFLKPADFAVRHLQKLSVSKPQASRFSNGNELSLARLKGINFEDDALCRVYLNDTFLGLGRKKGQNIVSDCIVNQYIAPIEDRKPCAVCLGTFDGLHAGHRAVLNAGINSGVVPVALLFDYSPSGAMALMSAEDKRAALYEMGFKKVSFLRFEDYKDMTFDEFHKYLVSRYNIAEICCGYDYSYGKDRLGNTKTLAEFCRDKSIKLTVIPQVNTDGNRTSSTNIRGLIENGYVDEANRLMYKPFSFETEVIHGDKRGRTLGFPTINQAYPKNLCVAKFGVYDVFVVIDGKKYKGVSNIGIRPTYKTEEPMCETYIHEFSGDVYGKTVRIIINRFIRPEQKFASADELVAQIKKDIDTVLWGI